MSYFEVTRLMKTDTWYHIHVCCDGAWVSV